MKGDFNLKTNKINSLKPVEQGSNTANAADIPIAASIAFPPTKTNQKKISSK